ncbi:MAG TPA: hypothetical protein VJM31_19375 [Vicinamibacterales bacterium]|nr:hypothetical protein [Vicinamibacterales bacterium]
MSRSNQWAALPAAAKILVLVARRIGANTHYTTIAPNHGVLAELALAFECFGHCSLQDIQHHGLVFVSLHHESGGQRKTGADPPVPDD